MRRARRQRGRPVGRRAQRGSRAHPGGEAGNHPARRAAVAVRPAGLAGGARPRNRARSSGTSGRRAGETPAARPRSPGGHHPRAGASPDRRGPAVIAGVSGELLSSAYLASCVSRGTSPRRSARHRPGCGASSVVAARGRHAGPGQPAARAVRRRGPPVAGPAGTAVTHVECHAWGHAAVVAAPAASRWPRSSAGRGAPRPHRRGARRSRGHRGGTAAVGARSSAATPLTLVDATRPWSRRVLTFDFPVAFRQPSALLALWALTSGPSLQGRSHAAALAGAIAGSDNATTAVCASLGRGVLEALEALMRELAARDARTGGSPRPCPIGSSSTSRSPSCIACSSCSSPKRASWCRCGIASTVRRTASRPSAIG